MRGVLSHRNGLRLMRWFAGRVTGAFVLIWIVATVVFLASHVVPGERAGAKLEFNRPLSVQYGLFLDGILHGDLGRSLVDDDAVLSEVRLRLPRTLELIVAASVLSVVLAVPAGVYAALHRGSLYDRIACAKVSLLSAAPVFVIGTLLVLLLARRLHVMPAGSYVPLAEAPGQHLLLLLLPSLTIAAGLGAVLFRVTRMSVLDVLARDFVRVARAKGVSRRRILLRHVLCNALAPVVPMLGLRMGSLLGGVVLVEYVFNWPGMSEPLLRAVEARDGPMVAGIILVVSTIALLLNLITDLVYVALDPRVRDR